MKSLSAMLALMLMVAVLLVRPAQASQKGIADSKPPVATTGLQITVVGPDARPIPDAAVTVAPLGLTGTTNKAGEWSAPDLQPGRDTALEVTVAAKGYRSWVLRNPLLRLNDTLILAADLTPLAGAKDQGPQVIDVPSHRHESGPMQNADLAQAVPAPNAIGTNTTPPTHIKVLRVSLNRIDTVEFRDYVKHVLPNEWISSWHTESLRSGAMASKTYAWYRTMYPKYPGYGYDTKDTTADQVYNPSVAYASTNQAVDDTWNYKMTRNGAIFQSQYCAGSYNASRTTGQCGENHGYNFFPLGSYMSQWGSQYWATNGSNWQQILNFYYDTIAISTISVDPPPPTNGSISTFMLGLNNVLWQRTYANSAWGNWIELSSPPGGSTSEPGVVASANGRVDVFIRGGDNALWQRTFANSAWGAWTSRGGTLTAAPDVTSPAAGQFDVVVKGADNHLYRLAFRNGAWGGWEGLQSPNNLGATSDPAIASENGRLVVFVRGSDNALWRREHNGAWGAWTTMGGALTSAPDAASYGPGHMDVVGRGSDNKLYHRVFLNGTWANWGSLDSPVSVATSNPTIAAAGGRVDVFVRGSNNALWQRSNISGTWGAWADLGGTLNSGPDATAFGTTVVNPPSGPLAVPYINQYQGWASQNCDCGPASVAMIARFFGRSSLGDAALVGQARQYTGTSTSSCTNTGFTQLQSALGQYQLTTSQIATSLTPEAAIQSFKDATASGKPVIAFVHGASLGRGAAYGDHWIVVKGFSSDGQTVYVNDPDNQPVRWTGWIQGGSITLPIATFRLALDEAASGLPYGIIVN